MKLSDDITHKQYYALQFIVSCSINNNIYTTIWFTNHFLNMQNRSYLSYWYATEPSDWTLKNFYCLFEINENIDHLPCCRVGNCQNIIMTNEDIKTLFNLGRLTNFNKEVIIKFMETL